MSYKSYIMRRVLSLAERGRGRTSPNPMVGAVIVKNGIKYAEFESMKEAEEAVEALGSGEKEESDYYGFADND